jgi:hypothetical protein
VVSNLLRGNDSFAAIRCNGKVISEPLLCNTIPAFNRHVTISLNFPFICFLSVFFVF